MTFNPISCTNRYFPISSFAEGTPGGQDQLHPYLGQSLQSAQKVSGWQYNSIHSETFLVSTYTCVRYIQTSSPPSASIIPSTDSQSVLQAAMLGAVNVCFMELWRPRNNAKHTSIRILWLRKPTFAKPFYANSLIFFQWLVKLFR